MNTPNKLSFVRIFLAIACIGFILQNTIVSLAIALLLFSIASITDFLDGYLARKYDLISDLGKLIDPIADKVLIIGTFLAFLQLGIVNAWMVVSIMFREFILTGLRFYGLSKGVVLEAKAWGKHKTLSQVVAIFIIFITIILVNVFPQSNFISFCYSRVIPVIMWYVVGITVFSGVHYFWINRKTIRTF